MQTRIYIPLFLLLFAGCGNLSSKEQPGAVADSSKVATQSAYQKAYERAKQQAKQQITEPTKTSNNMIKVTGKILFAKDKEPVLGASVKLKGNKATQKEVNGKIIFETPGSYADFDGNFVITVPADGVLEFGYIGCKTKEVKVDPKNPRMEILLEEE